MKSACWKSTAAKAAPTFAGNEGSRQVLHHFCFLVNFPPGCNAALERNIVTVLQTFSIRKSFLIPLGLLLAQCAILFFLTLVQGQPVAKTIILGFIILPVAVLFMESFSRRAVVNDEKVTVFKFLRRKILKFSEITSVETVMVRKRAFLTLCAGDDFLILSNAYADFPAMVDALLSRVPPDAVSEETRVMATAPPAKSTDVVSCWLGVLLLAFILYIQLGGRL